MDTLRKQSVAWTIAITMIVLATVYMFLTYEEIGGVTNPVTSLSSTMVEVEHGELVVTLSEDLNPIINDDGEFIIQYETDVTLFSIKPMPLISVEDFNKEISREYLEGFVRNSIENSFESGQLNDIETMTIDGQVAFVGYYNVINGHGDYFEGLDMDGFVGMFVANHVVYQFLYFAPVEYYSLFDDNVYEILENLKIVEASIEKPDNDQQLSLDDLIGTWGLQSNKETILVFQDDGTMYLYENNEVMEFDWEIISAQLSFRLEGVTLTQISEDGTDLVWLRQSYEPINLTASSGILNDIPFLNSLIEYTLVFEFDEIIAMVDDYLEDLEVSEDDVAYEIRELATRAATIMENMDVVVDDFNGQLTVYYSGVREIDNLTHVVPYIQNGGSLSPGRDRPHRAFSAATFYLLTGIHHESELGFTRTEIRMSDDRIIWRNHRLEDRNDLSIVSVDGMINEIAMRSWYLGNAGGNAGYTRRFERDMDVSYNHVLRFINQDTDATYDVTLSEREISSIATTAELLNIMNMLAIDIPEREF